MNMLKRLIYPFVKRYALNFLDEKNPVEKQNKLFQDKLKKQSKSVIGKKLGITRNTKIKDIPLTRAQYAWLNPCLRFGSYRPYAFA